MICKKIGSTMCKIYLDARKSSCSIPKHLFSHVRFRGKIFWLRHGHCTTL
ncbi:hypothetical protein CICLE_v10013543mg [Citrus x clementina]|uniref:Uncharacterized protein n=1 Tax=Citrus clementina TaxID=85681 RepID=V4T1R1_CITCL|nr:hypothetical protein CICLE_v10013543mg [Citrus x clementina]